MNVFTRDKLKQAEIEFPEEATIYDWCFDQKKVSWVKWTETQREFKVDTKLNYSEIVVPTDDSIRMKYLLKLLLEKGKHCLTPGPTGTGKTVNILEMVSSELKENFQSLSMTFSAQTSANQTQDYLDDKFTKRGRGRYGPEAGKKIVIFIDDLNMPKKEQYGAQPPLELIRQFMDHGGWYNRKDKEKPFMKIEEINLVCAMGPPGGG